MKPSPDEQKRLTVQYRVQKNNKPSQSSHYIKLTRGLDDSSDEWNFIKVTLAK